MTFDFNSFGTTVATKEKTAKKVGFDFNSFGTTVQPTQTANSLDQRSAEEFKPTFSYQTGESGSTSILKTIGNLPSSLWNQVKGIVRSINPVSNLKAVGQLGKDIKEDISDAKQGKPSASVLDVVEEVPQAMIETFVPKVVRNWLSVGANAIVGNDKELDKAIEEARRTSINDPANILPAFLALKGVAEAKGYGKQFDSAVSKIASPVIKPVEAISKGITKGVSETAKFSASQFSGLSPETIKTIINDPKAFSAEALSTVSRETLGTKVKTALETLYEQKSETGSGYDVLRKSGQAAEVKAVDVNKVFDKYGVKFDEAGKIIVSKDTTPLKAGDISALEDFKKVYLVEETPGVYKFDTNSFLNTRKALDNLSAFDSNKSNISTALSREMRYVFDQAGKKQIKGLEQLDTKFAPEAKLYKQLKSDYLNADGTLKDNALSKIANLTKKGREQVLQRLEKASPGISRDINILRAVEDIELTKGQKVGSYMRGAVGGFALSGGNPVVAFMSAFLAQPSIFVPMLRAFGNLKNVPNAVIEKMLKKMEIGEPLNVKERNLFRMVINTYGKKVAEVMNMPLEDFAQKYGKAGLSLEDVSKDLYAEARKYKSAEEFVKTNGTQIFRGSVKDGEYFSTSKFIAEEYIKQRGGKLTEAVLPSSAKVADYSDFPNAKYKGIDDYNVDRFAAADQKNILDFMDNTLEKDYKFASDWAKKNGYDAIFLPTEHEIRVLKPDLIKTKSQLTDIWKKANEGK